MIRVLVVDRSEYVQAFLRLIIDRCGYEIVGEAFDSVTAVEMCIKLKPEIIIVDITIPGYEGASIIQLLRSNDKNVRIIAVAPVGQKKLIHEAMEAGATAYIIKSFE